MTAAPDAAERRARITAEIVARTGIDAAMIERLVRHFYGKVREDEVLGPVFAARIADWEPHLTRMFAFWSSVALMSGEYHGSPMEVHMPLPVDALHFDRWLALFKEAAREVCPPVAAEHFLERARRIAQSLEMGIAAGQGVLLGKSERFLRTGGRDTMAKPPKEQPAFNGYASPVCYLHELDPAFAPEPDAEQRRDVSRWRKAERERLLAVRLAVDPETRLQETGRIAAGLDAAIGDVAGCIVSAYWPFRGEPDLRGWMEDVHRRGGRCALPVVVERARPLIFREWQPGAAMARGIWNIPVPAEGPEVTPDIVIAPVVGFDPAAYRLGYGGGYFDRTLAAMAKRPRVFGVGTSRAAIATIFPQPHDIPMDAIVTEQGLIAPATAVSGPPPAPASG